MTNKILQNKILGLVRPEISAMTAYQVPRVANIEVKLDANESPYPLSEKLQEALAAELAKVEINRYPDPQASRLRALIAEQYAIGGDSLLFGNGSDEIISLLMTTFAQPRDGQAKPSILYPGPTFSVFQLLAETLGFDTHCVPLQEDFTLNLPAVRAAIAANKPNLVFFARPNNPTGTLWEGADLITLAIEFPDVLFVSDEAYGEYARGSLVHEQKGHDNLLVMKTISKIGLAGLRIGFAIAEPSLIREINKARAPYNLSSLNQAAAVWALSHCRQLLADQCQEVVAQRARLAEALSSYPQLRVFESEANLILFRVGEKGEGGGPGLWQQLCERGVLIRKFGSEGPLGDCLRVTIGSPQENDRFLAVLADLL